MSNIHPLPFGQQSIGHQSPLLDRVLSSLDAEQRARVLDLVIRLELDPEDPLWLIALSIGQLQVLVQDAPEEWRDVFNEFLQDLQQWKTLNSQSIQQMEEAAAAIHHLTYSCTTLSEHLSELRSILSMLIDSFEESMNNNQHWQNKFETFGNDLKAKLSHNMIAASTKNRDTNSSESKSHKENGVLTWTDNRWFKLALGGSLLVLGLLNLGGILQQHQVQRQQSQQLHHLLERLPKQ